MRSNFKLICLTWLLLTVACDGPADPSVDAGVTDASPSADSSGPPDGSAERDAASDGAVEQDAGEMDIEGVDASPPAPPSPPRVVAGGDSTCVLFDEGNVRCWGDLGPRDRDEAIGDDERAIDAPVFDLGGRVVDLSVGIRHACALNEEREVRCWGAGFYGMLGYEAHTNVSIEEVSAMPPVNVGFEVASVHAFGFTSCAISTEGALRCWGFGNEGQLGYGDDRNVGQVPHLAGDVNVGGPVKSVEGSIRYTCAVMQNGDVRCWGLAHGHDTRERIGDDEVPSTLAPLPLGGRAVELAAGSSSVCALMESGAVRCWGRGDEGFLGLGSTDSISLAADATDAALSDEVSHVSAGARHVCAQLVDQTVQCWGFFYHGLGGGDVIGDDELPRDRGRAGLPSAVDHISSGVSHSCAMLRDGTLYCWGNAQRGQLGLGLTRLESQAVRDLPAVAYR